MDRIGYDSLLFHTMLWKFELNRYIWGYSTLDDYFLFFVQVLFFFFRRCE